ncbi:DNA-binding protein WhiA [Anaerorhabdus sp.]|uniref:DNA-binding protein WhiA n=1 Tax=Anaerorhabdus sp. TaxID=1872524 RepID=UPI002B21A605|nr:DNA-binding protein WhiA [Anaerorhabdus sp.]MEA4875876.1 DNA-binding protein WhiA [Anaerorhabdus sp.]
MSFTTEVKQEVGQNELKDCCRRAELSALVQLCSTLSISNKGLTLLIKTENATTAKCIWKSLKELYHVETDLSVMKKMNLRKNNIYYIRVLSRAREILEDLGIYSSRGLLDHPLSSIVTKECCARGYLAGAFMAMGSVNAPQKTSYHLEIGTNSESHSEFIIKLMNRFEIPAKAIKRRNQHVVYVKAADKIADFLRLIGAFESLMKFEDIRIHRDFKNSLTRLDNCEVANEVKSQNAAKKQLEDIEVIEKAGKLDKLEEKYQEIITLRKQNPEFSLNELSKEYERQKGVVMSKSGMKHRFTKIQELADKIRLQNDVHLQ